MQVLQGDRDGSFSNASYGFRPERSAHQAVKRAQEHIGAGFGPTTEGGPRTRKLNERAVPVSTGALALGALDGVGDAA